MEAISRFSCALGIFLFGHLCYQEFAFASPYCEAETARFFENCMNNPPVVVTGDRLNAYCSLNANRLNQDCLEEIAAANQQGASQPRPGAGTPMSSPIDIINAGQSGPNLGCLQQSEVRNGVDIGVAVNCSPAEILEAKRTFCGARGVAQEWASGRRIEFTCAAAGSGEVAAPRRNQSGDDLDDAGDVPTPPGTAAAAQATTTTQVPFDRLADLNAQYDSILSELDACQQAKSKAEQCCEQPETCIGEVFGANPDQSNVGLQALQMIAGGVLAFSQNSSIASMCGKMKNIAYAATAINASMGAVCNRKVGICTDACETMVQRATSLREEIRSLPAAIGQGPNVDQYGRQKSELETKMRPLQDGLARNLRECQRYNNAVVRAGMQAMASAQAAKMADLCKAQAGGGGLDNLSENDFAVNCTSAGAASNPVCQQMCQRPGAENDPACVAILRAMNQNGVANNFGNSVNNTFGDGTGDDFDVGDTTENLQDPNFVPAVGPASGLATARGGTGGMGGGSLPAAGGGGGGGAMGAPGGSGGFDSKILRGTNSGNGYTASGMRSGGGGGGFSGYGGRAPASAKGQKFSLKDFLPGGKMAPKRGLAGLSGSNPEIGAKTDDIFKRISGRFYQLCLQDRLYDCSTLRNMKAKGQ